MCSKYSNIFLCKVAMTLQFVNLGKGSCQLKHFVRLYEFVYSSLSSEVWNASEQQSVQLYQICSVE